MTFLITLRSHSERSSSDALKCYSHLELRTSKMRWVFLTTASSPFKPVRTISVEICSNTLCLLEEAPCSKTCKNVCARKSPLWLPQVPFPESLPPPIVNILSGSVELFCLLSASSTKCGSLAKIINQSVSTLSTESASDCRAVTKVVKFT
jgi:hypothetical protein